MSEHILENQIKLLEMQIRECKKEISLIRQENENYFYLMQSLLRLLTERDKMDLKTKYKEDSTVENLKETKEAIIYLKDQIEEIQGNIKIFHDELIKINSHGPKNPDLFSNIENPDNKIAPNKIRPATNSLQEKNEGQENIFKESGRANNINEIKEQQFIPGTNMIGHRDTFASSMNPNYESNRFNSRHISNESASSEISNKIITKETENKTEDVKNDEEERHEKRNSLSSFFFGVSD